MKDCVPHAQNTLIPLEEDAKVTLAMKPKSRMWTVGVTIVLTTRMHLQTDNYVFKTNANHFKEC